MKVFLGALLAAAVLTYLIFRFGAPKMIVPQTIAPSPITSACDDSLWQHVYHGRFPTPQDRLQVIENCKTVMGTIINAKAEADGDFHIRLSVDDKSLLNDKNISGQKGYLVVEPVCENPISQRDTNEEGVCDNFHQDVFTKDMIGKRVSVTGAYVIDAEHLWAEIHPVTSITVIK